MADQEEKDLILAISCSIFNKRRLDFREYMKTIQEELARAYKCVRNVTEVGDYSPFEAADDTKYFRLWAVARYQDKTATETKVQKEDWWPVFKVRATEVSFRISCFGGPKLSPKEVAAISAGCWPHVVKSWAAHCDDKPVPPSFRSLVQKEVLATRRTAFEKFDEAFKEDVNLAPSINSSSLEHDAAQSSPRQDSPEPAPSPSQNHEDGHTSQPDALQSAPSSASEMLDDNFPLPSPEALVHKRPLPSGLNVLNEETHNKRTKIDERNTQLPQPRSQVPLQRPSLAQNSSQQQGSSPAVPYGGPLPRIFGAPYGGGTSSMNLHGAQQLAWDSTMVAPRHTYNHSPYATITPRGPPMQQQLPGQMHFIPTSQPSAPATYTAFNNTGQCHPSSSHIIEHEYGDTNMYYPSSSIEIEYGDTNEWIG